MATDLASLNNALETQAANEGISISLTNSNNQPITTTNPATIDIDPSTATGSGVTANTILAATSITSNVKTAMPGYSLSISTNTDNSNLTNTDSNLSSTQNGSNILPTTGTQESPTQLTTNTWGYAMKRDDNNQYTTKFDTTYTTGNTNSLTSKWAKVPTNQAPQTIKHTEDTPQAAGDNTTVYYAANVPKTKTAGQYQTTIIYTATANILDPPEVEKVEPSSIRQGLSIAMGSLTPAMSSGGRIDGAYTCYLTDKGNIYCAGTDSDGVLSNTLPVLRAVGYAKAISNSPFVQVDTTKFDSSSSSAGRTITITGSKLSKVTGVYVDSNKNGQLDTSTDAQCTNLSIKSDSELTCTAPQLSPGTYNLFVVNASNQTMVPNALTYR